MNKDSIGDRMKRYERVTDTRLSPKTPVILRVDGKAFHTLTRGMERPFSRHFHSCMVNAAIRLCKSIDGARFAFQQSDEISILVADWSSLQAQPWFEYRTQKLTSVAASITTVAFNDLFHRHYPTKPAGLFDCRAFSVPMHEVVNYFIWRQQDATRNSIQMVAQAHFSHRQLFLKNQAVMQDMLHGKGINWNDTPTRFKRGVGVRKVDYPDSHSKWEVDNEVPIFTQDREYIERIVDKGEL